MMYPAEKKTILHGVNDLCTSPRWSDSAFRVHLGWNYFGTCTYIIIPFAHVRLPVSSIRRIIKRLICTNGNERAGEVSGRFQPRGERKLVYFDGEAFQRPFRNCNAFLVASLRTACKQMLVGIDS